MFLTQETSEADNKFSVTSILSSMANGQLLTPTSYSMVNFLTSGSAVTSPAALTPTTLNTLEQTITELQTATRDGLELGVVGGGGAGGVLPPSYGGTQSGFVPPIVDASSSREHSQDSYDESLSDTEWEPAVKRGRGASSSYVTVESDGSSSAPQRKYTRRSRHEKLSPEEERRRAVRRERNKLAAAKCRQRRVDHTNRLVEETEQLESVRSDLEAEIQTLQQQRDQLQFVLQAHAPICKVDPQAGSNFKIKIEPQDFSLSSHQHHHHHQQQHSPALPTSSVSSSLPTSSSMPTSSSSTSARPKSLALGKGGELPVVVSCAGPGITLSTPSSGLFTYTSLDSLVDGSTGLTPLTSGPVSCASQLHKAETEGDGVTSPTLITL